MITVQIDPKYLPLVENYAAKLDLGGRSNLSSSDLGKATRNEFQYTGLFGEIAYRQWLYGHADDLFPLLNDKLAHYEKTSQGDNGRDDEITYNGFTRFVDVKSSHTNDIRRIKNLNLIVPENEFHEKQIYIAAFTLGSSRIKIDQVILAGFCYSEDLWRKWPIDRSKFCVPVTELRDMERLKEKLAPPAPVQTTSNG